VKSSLLTGEKLKVKDLNQSFCKAAKRWTRVVKSGDRRRFFLTKSKADQTSKFGHQTTTEQDECNPDVSSAIGGQSVSKQVNDEQDSQQLKSG
jgi:hypothetical protein